MTASSMFGSTYSHPGVTMTKHFLVIIFLFYACFLAGVINEEIYSFFIQYSNSQEYMYIGSGLILSIALIILSIVFSAVGSFRLVYAMSKVVLEVSQFLVSLLSLFALALYFHFDFILWVDLARMIAIVPFLLLGAAAFSIRIFDFNYPVRNTLVGHFSLAVFSCFAIFIGEMFGF